MARQPRWRIQLALFALGLVGYGAVAGERIERPSRDPHFVYQAHAWLDGRLETEPMPRGADDPARVETVMLKDGSPVRGRRLATRPMFRSTRGDEIPRSEIERSLGHTEYVSFPPFPALLMLPQVALAGREANDVAFTVAVAAACLPLLFTLLCRLSRRGESERGVAENVLLTLLFGFGTVLFFSAVQGRVWFTAHVVAVAMCLLYVHFSLGARHPILAGVALACAALTRTPMAFLFPLFLFEAWRATAGPRRVADFARSALLFAAPVALLAAVAVAYNLARFDQATEFGHSYLAVRQQAQIEAHGLFSYDYLARNLAVAFTLLPELGGEVAPVRISGHGLALWVTTPPLLALLWPRCRGPLHRALWITVAAVAIPALFYQNSGWIQFGYRFALDYMVLLVLLLAIGGRRFGAGFKLLVVAAIAINLFGAVTFDRHHRFYRLDARTYSTVVAH